MTLPTFLVIGAMKAGTTSLWEYLRRHPQVFMPDEKELDFFVAEKRWARGVQWYSDQFAGAAGAAAIGEASTNYTKHPLFSGVPERALEVLPDVKVVYVVREPIERMRSHWLHARSAGWEARPFADAVRADPQYVDVSRYATQLGRWLEVVPRDRVHVMLAEHLRDDRVATMRRVLDFLGVDASAPMDVEGELHAAEEKAPPRTSTARVLRRVPGGARLAALLPARVRQAYGRATTVDLEREVALPPALADELRTELRPELARLAEVIGPGFDGWGELR